MGQCIYCQLSKAIFIIMLVGISAGPITSQTLLEKNKGIPDISAFMRISGSSLTDCSWDGNTIYFKTSITGAPQIFVSSAEAWPLQLTAFEDGVSSFVLSNNGDMAVLEVSTGGSEQAQLYLMETRTGQMVKLTNNPSAQFGNVIWSKNDNSIYFRSNKENKRDFFIYELNISSGLSKKIFGDTLDLRGDNSLETISQDGSKLIIAHAFTNVSNCLYILDLNSFLFEKITNDSGDVSYSNVNLMPDNKTMWLLCNRTENGLNKPAILTIGNGQIEFVSDDWVDSQWETERLDFSRDFQFLAVVINENGYGILKIVDANTRQEIPAPALKGQVSDIMFDRDGDCLFTYTTPIEPPDVWRWNPSDTILRQITFASFPGVDPTQFIEPQLINYKSFDGLEIPAFLYLPNNYAPGTPIPFIVYAHGGPESQTRASFQRYIQYLATHGYGVIMPNVRGSSGYGREYINLDNYKNRKKSLLDYKSVTDFLINKGYSEKGKLAIQGGSYGGYVVYGMISEYPDLFSAAIASVGIANFQTFLNNTSAYRRALREAEYGPLSDTAFLREISPIWKADQIKTPLLIIHGTNDPRVPISETRQMIKAIQDQGGIVDSLIFSDEGHGARKQSNIIEEYKKIIDFLKLHIKSPEPPPEQ
jgi:dipeptidyl aminopeptidase/acylaminoacyl peptidase